ncbi:MAG TPA: hypothetical protein VGC27_00545 [Rhizomicrobium sp.]
MGTVLRAVFAFAVAYAVYAPHEFAAHFETPRFAAVKADLAAAQPGVKLQRMIEDGLKRLPDRIAAEANGSPGHVGGHRLL